jgi:hypothetical protein
VYPKIAFFISHMQAAAGTINEACCKTIRHLTTLRGIV